MCRGEMPEGRKVASFGPRKLGRVLWGLPERSSPPPHSSPQPTVVPKASRGVPAASGLILKRVQTGTCWSLLCYKPPGTGLTWASLSTGYPRDAAVWYLIYGQRNQYLTRTFIVGCSLLEPFFKIATADPCILIFSSPYLMVFFM